ncbi:MAG: hypothetical protein FIA95_06400 [Gemmatimonadetes bacterium]|nr:hypothetical protein [Gemmatimonadota bacterium]
MSHDPFGNLEDWGSVLVTLKELTDRGQLDDAQEGITRLIRYPDNWRLRESALVAARQVKEPTSALLSAVANVLEDRATFVDARILAARALGDLAARKSQRNGTPAATRKALRATLQRQLESPEAPVLTRAIEAALKKIDPSRASA